MVVKTRVGHVGAVEASYVALTTQKGLVVLGQRAELSLDARHGSELLMFLGRSLAAIMRKWLTHPEL